MMADSGKRPRHGHRQPAVCLPEELRLCLPVLPDRGWYRLLDTACASPEDINTAADAHPVHGEHYPASNHSVVALISRQN